MNRFILSLALGMLAPLGSPALMAETWTNAAGQAISAQLETVKDGKITLRLPNGRTLSLPLSSLSKADQQRALSLTGQEPVPPEMADFLQQAEQDLRRASQFLRDGKLSREAFDQRYEQVLTRFERLSQWAAVEHGPALSPATLNRWRELLRQRSPAP